MYQLLEFLIHLLSHYAVVAIVLVWARLSPAIM
jgi:hypothetical protein